MIIIIVIIKKKLLSELLGFWTLVTFWYSKKLENTHSPERISGKWPTYFKTPTQK
jgi:hypothetical protein